MWQVGDKIGRLTVESLKPITLRCDCGQVAAYSLSHVVRSRVRSCGCLSRENTTVYSVGQEVAGMRLLQLMTEGRLEERKWLVQDQNGQRVVGEVYLKGLARRQQRQE